VGASEDAEGVEYDDVDEDAGLQESEPVCQLREFNLPITPKESVTLSVNDRVVIYYSGSKPGWYQGMILEIDETHRIPKYVVEYADGTVEEYLNMRGYGISSRWIKPT
jgi:hypothetical protein